MIQRLMYILLDGYQMKQKKDITIGTQLVSIGICITMGIGTTTVIFLNTRSHQWIIATDITTLKVARPYWFYQ